MVPHGLGVWDCPKNLGKSMGYRAVGGRDAVFFLIFRRRKTVWHALCKSVFPTSGRQVQAGTWRASPACESVVCVSKFFPRGVGTMLTFVKNFVRDEEGATMIEYGLMVALIAVALIATVTLLQGGITNTFTKATTELNK
jgi:pilus assembly protein Flp/PilA